MAKHPVYQTLAIQHEVNWLKALVKAAQTTTTKPETASEKSVEVTHGPNGQF